METALALLDAVGEAVILLAADGRALGANDRARRLLADRARAAVSNGTGAAVALPERAMGVDLRPLAPAELPWHRALAGGPGAEAELIGVPGGEGSVRWLAVTTRPLPDGLAPGGVAVTLTAAQATPRIDADPDPRADAARRDAERRFVALADVSPAGVFVADDDGSCTYTNEHWQAIYGMDAAEAARDGWSQAIHPADRAEVIRRWRHATRAGRTFESEFRVGPPDGPERWVLSRAVPVPSDLPGRGTFVGVVEDVTERRSAAEVRFGAMFDASPIGIAIIGADGRIRVANPSLAELTGREAGALRGHELATLVATEESEILRARLRELVDRHDSRAELELRLVRADGEVRWALVHVTRLGSPSPGGADTADAAEFVCQLLDMTERRRFEEQLRHVADHDLLTGLLNRRSFEAALAAHCAHVARYGAQGALLVLDIDRFKIVNDSFGHQTGDQLIAEVAALLRERLRATDSLARLGGDEFAALLPYAGVAEAESVAAALLDAVRSHAVPPGDGARRPVTVSIGIATFDPPDATPAEMLAAADLAMFAAKEAGRDRYAVAAVPATRGGRDTVGRASWVERIESALHEGRFALLAQPIVSLRTGLVAQFELFVRIVDDAELVTPERFLYLAERVDLVGLIDTWVLDRAIGLLTERAGESFALSVNLAQKSIGSPSVLELLERRLASPAFDPQRLVLEVGERSAMASVAATQRFLDLVSSLGCASALDDFGAGLGSLSYLKYLPFDFLKIDGAVVATCASNAVDRTLVSAITAVAGELGKQTIAEATPDQPTLDLLRRAGVDFAQGYFVGRPQPLDTVFPAGRPALVVPA